MCGQLRLGHSLPPILHLHKRSCCQKPESWGLPFAKLSPLADKTNPQTRTEVESLTFGHI